MVDATVTCPHCKASVMAPVGKLTHCSACGGELRVHEVGAGEKDEALRQLLSRVKIVERVGGESGKPVAPAKRPWWKFWG